MKESYLKTYDEKTSALTGWEIAAVIVLFAALAVVTITVIGVLYRGIILGIYVATDGLCVFCAALLAASLASCLYWMRRRNRRYQSGSLLLAVIFDVVAIMTYPYFYPDAMLSVAKWVFPVLVMALLLVRRRLAHG